MTTLGVIGLGRIGAFHTETLTNLPELDGLVITDERPDVVKAVAAKYGATPVGFGRGAAVVRRRRRGGRRRHPGACGADPGRRRGRPADVLREAGRRHRRRERPRGRRRSRAPACRCRSATSAGSTPRSPPPSAAVDDGSLGTLHTVRSTTMDPAPPPLDYIKGSGGIFRDCAVHDFDVLRWITGQRRRRGLRDRQRAGRSAVHRVRRCRHRRRRGDDSTAAPWAWCPRPLQRPRLRLPPGGARLRRQRRRGLGSGCAGAKPRPRATTFPTGPPHQFFMDRFTEAFRTELGRVRRGGRRATLFWARTVADAVEVAWIAEAATESLRRGRSGADRGGQEHDRRSPAPPSPGAYARFRAGATS